MRLTLALLAALLLTAPCGAFYYPTYYPPYYQVEKVTVVNQLVTVPTPVALFSFVAQPTTPAPVVVAVRQQVQAKTDPCCASPELTARLARIEQALALLRPQGPPPLSAGPPRLRPLAAPQTQAPPPPIKLNPLVGQIGALLRTRCAECHSGPGRGAVRLFNEQGEWEPNVSAAEVLAAVRPGKDAAGNPRPARMPRGKPSLTGEELALVEQWAKAD